MNHQALVYPILFFFLSAPLLANPAPVGGPGSTPVPMYVTNSFAISMVEETVEISDGHIGTYPAFAPRSDPLPLHMVAYRGSYKLKNTSKMVQDIQIGFPIAVANVYAGPGEGGVSDFKVVVSGREVNYGEKYSVKKNVIRAQGLDRDLLAKLQKLGVAKPLAADPGLVDLADLGQTQKGIASSVKAIPDLNKSQKKQLLQVLFKHYFEPGDFSLKTVEEIWYVFPVKFKAAETVELVISYKSAVGDARVADSGPYSFTYILKSGALWKGPIGKCRIILNLAKGRTASDYRIKPKGFKSIKPGQLQFFRSNYLPSANVSITALPRKLP